LVAAGADVNVTDNTGWTPLMRATYAGHSDAIRALIDAGADVNATNIFGRTALTMAEVRSIEEVLAALQGTPVQ
jgi:ankyrin repeat protein